MPEKKKSPRGSEFWQIIFPTMVGAALILTAGIWIGISGSTESLSRFAEIATVLLSIPVYLAAVLFGLILVGVIYLVSMLIQGIPRITGRVLQILDRIREGANRGSRKFARLVIEPAAFMAIFRRKEKIQNTEIKLND